MCCVVTVTLDLLVLLLVSVYSLTIILMCIMQCFSALTVLGTCVYGGALLATALDYFVEQLQMVRWLWDRVTLRHSGQPCWFSWLILSIWPGMLVFGFIIQFTITGRGIYHQKRKRNTLCLSITIYWLKERYIWFYGLKINMGDKILNQNIIVISWKTNIQTFAANLRKRSMFINVEAHVCICI